MDTLMRSTAPYSYSIGVELVRFDYTYVLTLSFWWRQFLVQWKRKHSVHSVEDAIKKVQEA